MSANFYFTKLCSETFFFRETFVSLGSRHTHNASLGVPLAAVAEGGRQRGGAALVVQGRASVVDGRVDGDGPHAGGVAVAVAVVVAAAVSRRPHVDAAFASAALKTPTTPSREKDARLGTHVISSSTTNILFTLSVFCFFFTHILFFAQPHYTSLCVSELVDRRRETTAGRLNQHDHFCKNMAFKKNATGNRDICCFLHPASLYSGLV